MRRRALGTFLGGIATVSAVWPSRLSAQQSAMPVIGFLHNASAESRREGTRGFFRGLAETGFSEGQNVKVEYRWAEDHNDRLAALASDLVQRKVAVIATPGSTQSALAAKAATQSIPIVFMIGTDPVEAGLVATLNRPGGNVTGVSLLNVELAAKRMELLHALVPKAPTISYLRNPTNPTLSDAETREVQVAARNLGVRLTILEASRQGEIEAAFATLRQQDAGALVVSGDPFFFTRIDQLVALSARYAIPTISHFREFTAAGGLINYGPSFPDAYRRVGIYTGRILKGEKPANLPVEQAVKIEFVLNLKTAKALGLTIPASILASADEVIE